MFEENAPRDIPETVQTLQETPLLARGFPGASISVLERFFAGKVGRGRLSDWRAGARSMPQWARDYAATELEAIARSYLQRAALFRKEKAPGRKAGAKNLAIWREANSR